MEIAVSVAAHTFAVAPMMDWTDRHCRYFHRLLSRRALLYTEMITAAAIVHGDHARLIGFDAAEQPLALQTGGSDPDQLAQAVRVAAEFGYGEVNLNVGCPSDRVQSGCFGAVLMEQPSLVAECVAAMIAASDKVEITVKCRIGVDEQDPEVVLPDFLQQVSDAGVWRFTIHARKAWLQGLSPKQNRDVPPLDYDLAYRMKARFPHLHLSVNGGVTSLDQAEAHLAAGMDGVMVGRAAYHSPADILCPADRRIFGAARDSDAVEAVLAMLPYIEAQMANGARLGQITRHMLGVFAGRPGARRWRQVLSEGAFVRGAGTELVERALSEVLAPAIAA